MENMEEKLKVGSKVEIISNIPFQLKKKPKPLLGTVAAIDGFYILVRPKYQRYECEFYRNELKLVVHPEDIRSTKGLLALAEDGNEMTYKAD